MGKKKIDRAGVIPYFIDDNQIQMYFMKPSKASHGGDNFQIAKGKIEDGEDSLEGGMREAKEELGLFQHNIVDTHKLGKFLGRTTVYIVEIKDPNMFGDPHFETKATKWMTPDRFKEEGRDIHKPVVKAAERYIKEKKNLGELK